MDLIKSAEHKLKAGVFGISRVALKRGRTLSTPLDGRRMKRVLFLRPEKLGDMVISLPVFDAIREAFPHLEVDLLGSPRNQVLVREDPRFHHVYLYRKSLLRDWREVQTMRRRRYDCVFDMIDDDSVTTLFLSQAIAQDAPRVGIGKVRFAPYYDHNHVHADGIGGHILDNALRLLKPFGIDPDQVDHYRRPYVAAESEERAARILAGLSGDGDVIGFNLSAGKPTRLWPIEKAIRLVQGLVETDARRQVLLITAPADRSRGEAVMAAVSTRVSMAPAGLGLLDVSALLFRLRLLISPDTSLIHIARSARVPVVGLYSGARKNLIRWRPYGQSDGVVAADSEGDLFDVSPDAVLAEVRTVLARTAVEVT
jgi:ADP-heptose:LPS heptosyltransferase